VIGALAAGLLMAAGLGTGLAVSLSGHSNEQPTDATAAPYDYYRAMMGRFGW
jgi:hypothetical protein